MKLAVLGCGNMGSALVSSLLPDFSHISFYTFTPSQKRAKALAKKIHGIHCQSIKDIPPCDLYLLACKPQHFSCLANELSSLSGKALVLSIMAGISLTQLSNSLKTKKITRAMPNLPLLKNSGACIVYHHSSLNKKERQTIEGILSCSSKIFTIDKEEDIDLLTGVSGSGPAYIFYIHNIICQYLQNKGIDQHTAIELTNTTFLGACRMLTKEGAQELQQRVSSKGGVTEAALSVFTEGNMESLWQKALDAAFNKARTLAGKKTR